MSGLRSLNVPLASGDFELPAGTTITMRLYYRSVQNDTFGDIVPMPASASDGEPGSDLCRFTTYSSASKQRGKRPYYYKEQNVGRVGVNLCKAAVEKAWMAFARFTLLTLHSITCLAYKNHWD